MKIRVVNPSGSGRALRRRAPNKKARRRLSGGGGEFIVAKPKRRRHRRLGSSSHRRRARSHNPHFGFGPRKRHRRAAHRRRNPSGVFSGIGAQMLWGTAGAVSSLALPGMVVPQWNTGWQGIALNGAVAFGGGMLVEKFVGSKQGDDFKVGGLIGVGVKIFQMVFGSNVSLGLSGDMGYYLQNSFPLPTTGQGPYLLNDGYSGSPMASGMPAAQPVTLPAPQTDDTGGGRFGSRFAA